MDKRKKLILYFLCFTVLAAILVYGIKYLTDRPYRKAIPGLPEMTTLPVPLREQITTADKAAKRSPSSDNLGNLGMVYHSSAYYDKAACCYQLAALRNRRAWIWSYYLGYLNLELGESKTSIIDFRHVTHLNREAELPWFYTGEAYKNMGMPDSAEIFFRKIISSGNNLKSPGNPSMTTSFPLNVYAAFNLSRILVDSGSPGEAEVMLKEIIGKYLMFGPAYRLLGNLYLKRGETAQGSHYVTRANDLADYQPPVDTLVDRIALISRSDIYLIKQIDVAIKRLNPQWAVRLLDNIKDNLPDNRFLVSKAIKLFLWTGYGNKALPFLEKHRIASGNDFDELMEIAELLYDSGFRAEGMSYFREAEKLRIDDAVIQARLALWLSDRDMNKEAVDKINIQLNKADQNVNVLIRGVYIYMKSGDRDRSKQLLSRLIRAAPANPEVLRLAGIMSEDEGRTKDAAIFYKKALREDPGDLSVIQALATLYMREEMWKDAIELFRRSLVYHPNTPFLLEGLGKLLVSCPDRSLRNVREGLEYSERAFIRSTSPVNVQISSGSYLAAAYAELGDFGRARYFMNYTVNLARKNNLSREYLNYLEGMLKNYSFKN
jgi:tetratricopeptide (TPR) repeat protein